MWKFIAATLLITASVFAEEHGTAYGAMRTVGAQLGRGALSNIISITGTAGNPQPARWKVLLADRASGGARELEVANGRIVSDRPANVSESSPATISTSKLNLDSSGAYAVAAHTADTSHLLFNYVNYTLRTDRRGNPMWIVSLETNARQPAGTIYIGANKGNITRVEGMYRGTNQQQVEAERTIVRREDVDEPPLDANQNGESADDEDENFIKHSIKQAFRRTRRDAEQVFERVRQSFDDFMSRH